MHRCICWYLLPTLLVLSSFGCGGSELDSDGLREALLDHGQALVQLDEGSLEGNFVVERSVTLRGSQTGTTKLLSSSGAVIRIENEMADVTLEDLEIDSSHVAILGHGVARLTLRNTTIRTQSGVGAYLRSVGELIIEDGVFEGTLASDMLEGGSEVLPARDFPVVGLYLDQVGRADLRRIDIHGYAGMPVIFHQSSVSWVDGSLTGNAGANIVIEESHVNLASVQVVGSVQGTSETDIEPIGLVVSDGAKLTASDLMVRDLGGFGLLQHHGQSSHSDLLISGAKYAGVWVQASAPVGEGSSLAVSGQSVLENNAGSGLVFLDSKGLDLRNVVIRDSVPLSTFLQMDQTREVSDGIHLQAATGAVDLSGVTLAGHNRVAVLLCGGMEHVISRAYL